MDNMRLLDWLLVLVITVMGGYVYYLGQPEATDFPSANSFSPDDDFFVEDLRQLCLKKHGHLSIIYQDLGSQWWDWQFCEPDKRNV